MPMTGTMMASTSRYPPPVVARASAIASISHRLRLSGVFAGASGSSVARPVSWKSRSSNGDRERGGREGDDDAGDDHRLRHRIGGEAGGRALARDDAEQQEDAAAQDVEGEDLAQRVRIDDEAVEAEADQRRARQSGQRSRRSWHGGRLGGPMTSMGSVAAIESVMNASMNRISGLAQPAG